MNDFDTSYVNYFKKQFLRAEDFSDEQAYHQAMRRRHYIAHHSWGIVNGLEVALEEGNIVVQPGFAVDGYGRELILIEKLPIRNSLFVEKGSNQLDVWLLYNRRGSDEPISGYSSCDPKEGTGLFYRWQEFPLMRITPSNPDDTDRRKPPGVPEADMNFPPFRCPPDDPLREWMVFLGQLLYDPNNQEQPVSVNLSGRPYAGLVGGQVRAPSEQAWLQIGHEDEADPRRFGVFIKEADPKMQDPRLEIDRMGEITLRGDTTLEGNLTVVNGAVEFGVGDVRGSDRSWRVYRTRGKIQVEDDQRTPQELDTDELRIEIPKGSGDPQNRFVIGTWFEQSKRFEPCLVVDDNCTITLRGNLVVEGTMTELQPRKEGVLTAEAKSFVVASTLSGIGGASAVIPLVFNRMNLVTPQPFVQPVGPGPVEIAQPAAFDADALIQKLDTDPEALKAFTAKVKGNKSFLRRFRSMISARGS